MVHDLHLIDISLNVGASRLLARSRSHSHARTHALLYTRVSSREPGSRTRLHALHLARKGQAAAASFAAAADGGGGADGGLHRSPVGSPRYAPLFFCFINNIFFFLCSSTSFSAARLFLLLSELTMAFCGLGSGGGSWSRSALSAPRSLSLGSRSPGSKPAGGPD